ncbi:MAG: HAD-IB family hydrolase [Eggerthellaceae bacterium]
MPKHEHTTPYTPASAVTNREDAGKFNKQGQVGAPGAPVPLAVYDFDGTSITGNSPVLLVAYMARRGMLKFSVLLRILLWAFAYKMRLPQNESSVRSLVFTAFVGRPKEEVDAFLREFYDARIAPRFRKSCDASMREHRARGHVVLIVSATFEPIIERAHEVHPFDYQISTRMAVDAKGNYTNEVAGNPVEGEEKPRVIAAFADELFGEGGWTLAYAYGDHHSDRPMLYAASEAFAVTPDWPLAHTARQLGWPILKWK